jgi:predicted phosphodiesterase
MKWTEENIRRLLACRTDQELAQAFPGYKLESLRRLQRRYREEAVSREPSLYDVGEVERLREEVKRLREYIRQTSKEAAESQAIANAIREVVKSRPAVAAPRPPKLRQEVEVESAVLVLSDFHYGEVVSEEETGGIAVYSPAICEARFAYTIEKAIQMAKEKLRSYHFPKLYVFALGDWVSGLTIKEIEISNEMGVVEQALLCAEMVEKGLLQLCQSFEQVVFVGVAGNHSRVKTEKYFKLKQVESYDYLIYKILEQRLARQPNLIFHIPRSFWAIERVENTRFMLMHGDQVRSWMGMPWYGLQREYLKWRALAESFVGGFDNLVVGHFHSPNRITIQRNEIIINGSLKGGDEFSLGAISAATDPVQFFFGVHPRRGITWEFRVNSKDVNGGAK